MMEAAASGRDNQKRRTRRHLLDAAARLLAQGRKVTLEDIATEALVSRATVYRYFTSPEQLMAEAALDLVAPQPAMFEDDPSTDPVARLERADEAMDDMIRGSEMALRAFLITALQRKLDGENVQVRQNRRTPLIEAALAPAKHEFKPAQLAMLRKAMALVMGTESLLAFKDVLGLDEAETRRVKRWMIKALVEAARK